MSEESQGNFQKGKPKGLKARDKVTKCSGFRTLQILQQRDIILYPFLAEMRKLDDAKCWQRCREICLREGMR